MPVPPKYFADFSSSRTDPQNFPFATWAKLMREIISEKSAELMVNAPCGGVFELRCAIAEHLREFRGIDADPNCIVVGAGTEYLYGLLIQLLGFDKVYALEDPGYRKIAQVYESYGVQYRFTPMDKEGIDPKALEKSGADILHISPSHHFPTGIVTPIARRYTLLDSPACLRICARRKDHPPRGGKRRARHRAFGVLPYSARKPADRIRHQLLRNSRRLHHRSRQPLS